MDFLEADRRYEELKRRHNLREIGTGALDARLKQLMVWDGEGRLWAKSRETGEWHCKDGDAAWARGTPPLYRQGTPGQEDTSGRQQGNYGGQPSYAPESGSTLVSGGRRVYRWILIGCGGLVTLLAFLVLGLVLVISPLIIVGLVGDVGETERSAPTSSQQQIGAREVSSTEEARTATVEVLVRGDHMDFADGEAERSGGASGFLIDQEGAILTNSHVVTGAEEVYVRLDGEETPREARVVATAECQDLAVLDIDGEGYPYFGWRKGAVKPGLQIHAAGFPGSRDRYTLTRSEVTDVGALSLTGRPKASSVKFDDGGEVGPGSSGGPLMTGQGEVVGVIYGGNKEEGYGMAIPADEAYRISERLKGGESIDSVGLKAQVAPLKEGRVAGLGVAAITPGSPAEAAGLLSGDIVTKVGGSSTTDTNPLELYCAALRGREEGDSLSLEGLRPDTGRRFSTELYG